MHICNSSTSFRLTSRSLLRSPGTEPALQVFEPVEIEPREGEYRAEVEQHVGPENSLWFGTALDLWLGCFIKEV